MHLCETMGNLMHLKGYSCAWLLLPGWPSAGWLPGLTGRALRGTPAALACPLGAGVFLSPAEPADHHVHTLPSPLAFMPAPRQ